MDTLSPQRQTCPCTELDFLSLTTGRKKDSSKKVRVRYLQEKASPLVIMRRTAAQQRSP